MKGWTVEQKYAHIMAKRREYFKRWYEKHKDAHNEVRREYNRTHREQIRERKKQKSIMAFIREHKYGG
jgi:DNA polymerase III delta prime subunit